MLPNRFPLRHVVVCCRRMSSPPNVRALGLFFVIAALVTGCGGGVSYTPLQTAPSGLAYSQPSISAVVNQAISPDAPAVTGTVDSYAVSPSLPAGLMLSTATGMISGTPTAAAAQASYTVTGSNAAGTTTAEVQIAVAALVIAPSGLAYPQAAINATVGQTIAADTPTVTGTVTSYTVNPALPAGLAISSTTGTITGTPTAASAQAAYTVTAANSAGSTTATVQITVTATVVAPAALIYPQTTINTYVGQAIASDTPTVTGTVTSYAVSPALPAGLMLSTTTGTISGTPTAVTAQAAYTVTAGNSAGSTTATVQIAVATPAPAPTGLIYPQTTITTYVGQAVTPDIPGAAGGTITSFSISPALPPGLSLNTSTGVISGTPTAAAAQATYVVTGSNSGGSVTAAVSPAITVTAPPIVLMQLGNQNPITDLQFVNSSVLSEDVDGLWALRDYTSGAIVASGNAALGEVDGVEPQHMAQMAGPTLAVGIVGGIEVLSSASGQPIGIIVSPGYDIQPNTNSWEYNDAWQLASDGSYISLETPTGLFVYAPSGQLLFSLPGNYFNRYGDPPVIGFGPFVFAAPGQVQIADGPAGANTVQTILVPSGVSTVSAPYQGGFIFWFTDGGRFLTGCGILSTCTAGTVWTYSSSGVEQAAVQYPAWHAVGGAAGNWIWTTWSGGTADQPYLNIYPVGSTTPALSSAIFTGSGSDYSILAASGTSLEYVLGSGSNTVSIIDLSGAAPVETDYTIPPPFNHGEQAVLYPFAAVSSAQWVAGANSGVILDGASLSKSTPRYFGNGNALSIGGSADKVAIATGDGQITWFNPADTTPQGLIGLMSPEVELSSDGSVLAAMSEDDALLNVYSLPSATISNTFSYPNGPPGLLLDFSLSGSGTTLGTFQDYYTGERGVYNLTLNVTPVSGSPTILSEASESLNPLVVLSPDGTMTAVTNGALPATMVTIYQGGTQVASVPGVGVGWIDNGRLLVDWYSEQNSYSGCTIYSNTGAVLATPPLPELKSIQPVTSDTVYAPIQNAIYSLTTGQATWTSPYLPDFGNVGNGLGAVAGPYVVFESEGNVIAVHY